MKCAFTTTLSSRLLNTRESTRETTPEPDPFAFTNDVLVHVALAVAARQDQPGVLAR